MRRRPLLPCSLAGFTLLCACPATPTHPPERARNTPLSPPFLQETHLEGLPAEAKWSAWVDALRQGRLPIEERSGCLLLAPRWGFYRLGVPLRPAVQPIPPARELTEPPAEAAILTRWGRLGHLPHPRTLIATLTEHPPPRPPEARVLLLAGGNAWLLEEGAPPQRYGRLLEARDALRLRQRAEPVGLLVVTASASLPLGRLHAALRLLDAARDTLPPLALGIVLPEGTRPPPEPSTTGFTCTDAGTMGTPTSQAEGVDRATVTLADEATLERRLTMLATECLRRAMREGTPPGRLELRVTFLPERTEACTTLDEPRDPRLTGCLVEGVRHWRLQQPPSPPLQIRIPLRLKASESPTTPPRAVCDPATST